jgi:hypothetical protein
MYNLQFNNLQFNNVRLCSLKRRANALVTQTTAIYAEDDRKIGFLETLHFFCPKLVEKQKVA